MMLCLVFKLRELSVWRKNPFQYCKLHNILMPVHRIWLMQFLWRRNIIWRSIMCYCCEGKLVTTLFHLVTEKKKIKKPVGIHLKSSYFWLSNCPILFSIFYEKSFCGNSGKSDWMQFLLLVWGVIYIAEKTFFLRVVQVAFLGQKMHGN